MPKSLLELLQTDLSELAYLGSNVVASEEAIRVMLEVYKTRDELKTITYVPKEDLFNLLSVRIKESNLLAREGHYQFFIEIGERSKVHQGHPNAIHYCALDLFIRPGSQPIAFVADHFQGFSAYYQEFNRLAKTFNIKFVVAGGATYQADHEHCLIFSLDHLLLTAKDSNILNVLDSFIAKNPGPGAINMHWNELPPPYLKNAQSLLGTILSYVENIKEHDGSALNEDSPSLLAAQFPTLISYTFKLPDRKVLNYGIKYSAAHHAGQAVLELDRMEKYLLDICYSTRYPLIYKLLYKTLALGAAYSRHPLFGFVFYHAHILEDFLKNKHFEMIFNHSSALFLMQKKLLSPTALFGVLTYITNIRTLDHEICQVVSKNLKLLDAIRMHKLDEKMDINPESLIDLMKDSKTLTFINHPIFFDLFQKGMLPLELVKKIKAHLFPVSMFNEIDTDTDRVDFIKDKITISEQSALKISTSTVVYKNESSSEDDIGFDLFDVPEVPVQSISLSPRTKPPINIGLLAKASHSPLFFATDSLAAAGGPMQINESIREDNSAAVFS